MVRLWENGRTPLWEIDLIIDLDIIILNTFSMKPIVPAEEVASLFVRPDIEEGDKPAMHEIAGLGETDRLNLE